MDLAQKSPRLSIASREKGGKNGHAETIVVVGLFPSCFRVEYFLSALV